MLRRVRRAMALTTVFVAVVCVPAAPALADLGDADPGGGNTTPSTTVDTTPTAEPSPDPTTTTTTTTDSSSTTTTVPADDAGATTTSSSPATPGGSTTSTSSPSSGASGRSTKPPRPSVTTSTASAPTTTTAPASSPTGAVVTSPPAESTTPAGGGISSGGSGRTTHPSPARPGKDAKTAVATPPDPRSSPGDTPLSPGFDAAGLGGLLGVGADAQPLLAGVTSAKAAAGSEFVLPGRDHGTPSSAPLLGLSLLILLALAGGAAYHWWDRRPGRYWPA